MKFKFFKTALSVAIFSIALLHTVPVGAKTVTPKKLQVSGFSKIFLGTSGEVVASRKNKVSTNQKLYVNFSPKNTKNIGIHVKSSDSSVLEVKKVNKHKFQFMALKEGKATLTITSQYKSKEGKSLSVHHELTIAKDNAFRINLDKKNHFLLTLNSPISEVTNSDLKVTSSDGKKMSIRSALLSDDKKQISVTTYENFMNQTEYTITFNGFNTSFTPIVEQTLPTSLKIKTKEVKKGEPTALEVEFLDENGNNITEVVDKAGLSITAEVESGSYSKENRLLTLNNYNSKANITARYELPNGSSLSEKKEIKVILDEEYKKQIEELAELEFLANLPKGPTIESMVFNDDVLQDNQNIILTMTDNIEDKDKARYSDKNNYDITLVDNFKNTAPKSIPIKKTISIQDNIITIILSEGTAHAEVHRGNITLKTRTKGKLPSCTSSISTDLRSKNKLQLENKASVLTLNSNNKQTLKLTFATPTEGVYEIFAPSNPNKFPLDPHPIFNSDKTVLTLTFQHDYTTFQEAYENKVIEFIVKIPNRYETYRSVIEAGKTFKVTLKCTSVIRHPDGYITSATFDDNIQLINN